MEPLLDFVRLTTVLDHFGVQYQEWGVGRAKSPKHLLREIHQGDSELLITREGLRRAIRIVSMRIHDTRSSRQGLILVEKHQIIGSRVRPRNRPPAGKIAVGQSPMEALRREMGEELRLRPDQCAMSIGEPSFLAQQSDSFPGLVTRVERFIAHVTLNPGQFIPDDYQVPDHDGKILVFAWEPETLHPMPSALQS